MDQVFKEEQAKLNEIEQLIESAVERNKRIYKDLSKEVSDFYPLDYKDVSRKKELLDLQKRARENFERYTTFLPSPYCAREILRMKMKKKMNYVLTILEKKDSRLVQIRSLLIGGLLLGNVIMHRIKLLFPLMEKPIHLSFAVLSLSKMQS